MKSYVRLNRYRVQPDSFSLFLSGLRLEITIFSNWPEQDNKALRSIVSSDIKLLLQESGRAELTTGDTRFAFGPGSAVLIPPYTVYDAETFDNVNSFEIFFRVSPVTRQHEFLSILGSQAVTHYASLITPADFALLRRVYADMQAAKDGAYAELCSLVVMLLVRMRHGQSMQGAPAAANSREQAVIERLLAYLDEHIGEPVHVEDACSALQVSQSYLYRCSRDVMNCSTRELITRHKMEYARTLLRSEEMTVSEVAEAVGYNPYHFSSQFKKSFHKAPSEYRRR